MFGPKVVILLFVTTGVLNEKDRAAMNCTSLAKRRICNRLALGLIFNWYMVIMLRLGKKHAPIFFGERPVADPENFGGGGFEAQNLKNSDVFIKIESDFSAEIGNSNVFFAQIQVVSKKKKGLHQN